MGLIAGMAPGWRLTLLGLLALLCCAAFMTLNVQGNWAFVFEYRGTRLAAMLLVAVAIGLSTVLFQTMTHNRILTPSLMGFDVLYVLVQSLALFLWGLGSLTALPLPLRFGMEVGALVLLVLLIFRLLFSGSVRSLHLMILLGILFGMLFRELSGLALRVLDPSEFSIQQGRSFASFSRINLALLGVVAGAAALAGLLLWQVRRYLDVLALGRDIAINLGVHYRRLLLVLMTVIAVLVSASTALVGPTLFFGLVVANLAYWLMGTQQHRWTLPASVLAGVVCLVGGQVLLDHLFLSTLPLAMVIELAGGLLFIALLMRGVKT